jgi:hypothetical protein
MSTLADEDNIRRQNYSQDPIVHANVEQNSLALSRALHPNVIVQMTLDAVLYGRAYAEIVRTSDGVDLHPLDPRYIRERKDPETGKLLGYVQFLTFPLVTLKPEDVFAFHIGNGVQVK